MDRKQAILDSAERLVRSRGYDGFSYADLEREIGIRKASIHHHFTKKSDLALALIERYYDRFLERLAKIANQESTAAARLTGYLDIYRDALSGGDTVCLCVALVAARDNLSAEVLEKLDGFHEDSIQWLTSVFLLAQTDESISGVTDPHAEATACLAMVEGALLIARASHSTARFEDSIELLRKRVVRA